MVIINPFEPIINEEEYLYFPFHIGDKLEKECNDVCEIQINGKFIYSFIYKFEIKKNI